MTDLRPDLKIIANFVPAGSRVLDLGCGDGALLDYLVHQKAAKGRGIELGEASMLTCVRRGLSVRQGNLQEGLGDYPDRSFDYVVLSQTLQEAHETVAVLREALRVGRFVVASFPNFGHWKARLQLLVTGRAPVTGSLPYQWYDTPNVHSLTIKDFRAFTRDQGMRIVNQFYLGEKEHLRFWPNLRAAYGVFVLEKVAAPVESGTVE